MSTSTNATKKQTNTKNNAPKKASPLAVGAKASAVSSTARAKPVVKATPMASPRAGPILKNQSSSSTGWMTMSRGTQSGSLRRGRMERKSDGNKTLIRGCELLAPLQIYYSAVPGTRMFRLKINPLLIGARLPEVAKLYAKFVFRKLAVHYRPAISPANAAANGLIMIAFTDDPEFDSDNLGVDFQAVQAVASWGDRGNSVEVPVYGDVDQRLTLDLKDQIPLFVDSTDENRFGEQGEVFVLTGTAIAVQGSTATTLGHIFLEYEVELTQPLVETPNRDGIVYGCGFAVVSAAAGNSLISETGGQGITQWYGDPNLIAPLNYAATGANLFFPSGPLVGNDVNFFGRAYRVTMMCDPGTAAATITVGPTLTVVTGSVGNVSNYPGYNSIGTTRMTSTTTSTPSGLFQGNSVTNRSILFVDWWFCTKSDVTMSLVAPSIAGASQFANVQISIERLFGQAGTSGSRVTPNVVGADGPILTPVMQMAYIEASKPVDISPLIEAIKVDAAAGQSDPVFAYICGAFGVQCDAPATQSMFVGPLIARAAAFLLKTYGPRIAAHVLHVGIAKLEAWARG